MAEDSPDWEKLRAHWQKLQRSALHPEDVFDSTAQIRIGFSIAQEAASAPGKVHRLKLTRRTKAYYLLQAADAQEHAHSARSPTDREAWLRLAHSWLKLLEQRPPSREPADDDAVEGHGRGQNISKISH